MHHFLQRFDLWGVNECVAAEEYLDESYETFHGRYLTLRDWAKSMDVARQLMVSFMQTKENENVVLNGIWVDGTVHWPSRGIAVWLRVAETKLS